jgi:chromosome segregation ATPase
MGENCANLKDDIQEIKEDIKEIKADLSQHMARTAASEARLEVMEELVKNQLSRNNEIIDKVFDQSDKNQKALNKQLMISIGVFSAIAALVTALAAWISQGGPTP